RTRRRTAWRGRPSRSSGRRTTWPGCLERYRAAVAAENDAVDGCQDAERRSLDSLQSLEEGRVLSVSGFLNSIVDGRLEALEGMSFETFDAVPVTIDEDAATGGLGSEVAPPQTPSSSSSSGGGGLFMSPARRRAQSDDGPGTASPLPPFHAGNHIPDETSSRIFPGARLETPTPEVPNSIPSGVLEPPRRALSIRGLRSAPGPLLGELRSKIRQNVQLERSSQPSQKPPGTVPRGAPSEGLRASPSPRRGVVGIGRKVASSDPLVELFKSL
ncbi:hypothetical protein THAOC_17684, partial [Thalassiosira oceanica]